MKQKPKIETYGVVPKKKVEEITNNFDWKKWKLPIFLFSLLAIGGLFSLFSIESEDRYQDLKINEEQRIVESNEGTDNSFGVVNTILTTMPIIIVIAIVAGVILPFFMRGALR